MKTVADWDTLPQAGKGYSVHSWGLHELPAVAGTRRQLQQTKGAVTLVGVSPSAGGGRGWHVGGCSRPTSSMPLNNDASFPRQTILPLGPFPAMEPLTSVPCCICSSNSIPFPRSALIPCFSTQPLPALVDFCLR